MALVLGGWSGRVMKREAGPLPDPAKRGTAWQRPDQDTGFWVQRTQLWIPHSRDSTWETEVQTGVAGPGSGKRHTAGMARQGHDDVAS